MDLWWIFNQEDTKIKMKPLCGEPFQWWWWQTHLEEELRPSREEYRAYHSQGSGHSQLGPHGDSSIYLNSWLQRDSWHCSRCHNPQSWLPRKLCKLSDILFKRDLCLFFSPQPLKDRHFYADSAIKLFSLHNMWPHIFLHTLNVA